MREERQAPRIAERLAVEMEIDGARHEAASRNISTGGMFIETGLALKVGQRFKLKFSVPAQKDPIAAEAEVRWVEDGGAGVRFIGLRAKDVWALGKIGSPSGPIPK
jgi:uncharacterized protein (TIGR02266 family)